jgi:H+/Cl- antiporter ClcA
VNAASANLAEGRGDFSVDRRLALVSAIALGVGMLGTIAAVALLDVIRFFTNLFWFGQVDLIARSPAENHLGAWGILVPALGGLIVGLVARFGSEKIRGHGIPEAIEAILFGKSRMSPKVAVLKPLSSGIVIGSGGPFGAEGPIIMTGGAIGSLVAQAFHLSSAERKTLLVAGACAGMTAVFGTPVAAVLLAVELLLFELRPRSLMPVALACALAGFVRTLWLDPGPLFPMQTSPLGGVEAFALCIGAGLSAGGFSALATLAQYRVEDAFQRLPLHWMWWPALGGLVVGLGGLVEPRALGVGYDVIGDLLHNHLLLSTVLALIAVKAVIWVVALGSGTSGGVLAPLLMMGAALGLCAAAAVPGTDPRLWSLVCMAAVLGGMMRAPLMAVVFAFELSHDVNALLPLLLASAVAYGFTVLTMPRSILTEKIARRGYHIHREYGADPMERIAVAELMTAQVVAVEGALSIGEVSREYFGAAQAHRAYPVVEQGRYLGMLDREMLANATQGKEAAVATLVRGQAALFALPQETARLVAARMASADVERIAVVDDAQGLGLVGILSRSDLVEPAKALHEEELKRERFLRWPHSGS